MDEKTRKAIVKGEYVDFVSLLHENSTASLLTLQENLAEESRPDRRVLLWARYQELLPQCRRVLRWFLMFSTGRRRTATGLLRWLLLCLEARDKSLLVACN